MSNGNIYRRKNPVARVFNAINRPQTHRDRTIQPRRQARINVRNYKVYC